MGETGKRIVQSVPLIAFAIGTASAGGVVWALAMVLVGVLCLHELYDMMRRARPIDVAGFLALAALLMTAHFGDRRQLVMVLALALPVTFFLAVVRPRRENVSWGIAATLLGVLWIGVALTHAVLLRDLPHGGALLVDSLIGVFVGDTCAYFGGRSWGRTQLAPRISPNKTIAGLVSGIVGGTLGFWLFGLAYQHEWFGGNDRLAIGFAVAAVAPVGDLFESLVKRDLGVKDAGRTLGAHGGALDRIDGALFAVVAAYYVSLAVL